MKFFYILGGLFYIDVYVIILKYLVDFIYMCINKCYNNS